MQLYVSANQNRGAVGELPRRRRAAEARQPASSGSPQNTNDEIAARSGQAAKAAPSNQSGRTPAAPGSPQKEREDEEDGSDLGRGGEAGDNSRKGSGTSSREEAAGPGRRPRAFSAWSPRGPRRRPPPSEASAHLAAAAAAAAPRRCRHAAAPLFPGCGRREAPHDGRPRRSRRRRGHGPRSARRLRRLRSCQDRQPGPSGASPSRRSGPGCGTGAPSTRGSRVPPATLGAPSPSGARDDSYPTSLCRPRA